MSSRRWSRQAIRARRARQSARRVFRRTSRAPREPHRQPVVRVSALPQAYPGREASHGRAETSVAEERECRDSDLLAYLRSVRLPRRRERTPCRTARHVTPPAGGCGRLRHGISAKNRVHDPGRCMRSRSRRAQGASARRSGPKHSEPGRNVEPQERPIIRRSTDPFVRLVRDALMLSEGTLRGLDLSFTGFHTAVMAVIWVGLGPFYGFGYCPLTDWNLRVLAALGERDLPRSPTPPTSPNGSPGVCRRTVPPRS